MTPEHEGPSLGHILSEAERNVEGWNQLTKDQADALLLHLTDFIRTIDPLSPTRSKSGQDLVTQQIEERYWQSFDRVQDAVGNAKLIVHLEHIAVAMIIDDQRTRLNLSKRR